VKHILRVWVRMLGERVPILAKLLLVVLSPFPRPYLSVARVAGLKASARNRVWVIGSGPLAGRKLTGLLPDEIGPILTNTMEIECARALSRLMLRGTTILDVGASYGYYSLLFSRLVGDEGQVYSFEPDPQTFQRLVHNLALNQAANVVPVPLCISNTRGLTRWASFDDEPWLSRMVRGPLPSETGRTHVSPVATLDDFCATEEISEHVRLVKIDVEGAEPEVLEGMLRLIRLAKPSILCELHGPAVAQRVYASLTKANYAWTMVEDAGEQRQHILAFPREGAAYRHERVTASTV